MGIEKIEGLGRSDYVVVSRESVGIRKRERVMGR